jgi:hypothetical protein
MMMLPWFSFFLDTLDHDPVVKRTELHGSSSNFFGLWCERLPRDATTGREMVRFDQLTSDICSK